MKTLLANLLERRGISVPKLAESVLIPVDHVYGHDRNTFKVMNEVELIQKERPDRLPNYSIFRLYQDHYGPPPNEETAELHRQQREISSMGSKLFRVGRGVGHQLALEHLVSPGEVAVGVDSHTCTVGALGALGLAQSPPAVANALVDGHLRFDMPRLVRIELTGQLDATCCANDIALHLATFGKDRFADTIMEFGGSGVATLDVPERVKLANLSSDLRARTALVETDHLTHKYLSDHGRASSSEFLKSDPSCYDHVIEINLSKIEPMVALPPTLWGAQSINSITEKLKVDVVTIGSCTSGRFEDFASFMRELDGCPVAKSVRVIATPASDAVYGKLLNSGIASAMHAAGIILNPPGCGPCMGLHQGVLSKDEVCVATGSRNAPGRMGSKEARVILAGPKIAGASARIGFLSAPNAG